MTVHHVYLVTLSHNAHNTFSLHPDSRFTIDHTKLQRFCYNMENTF